MGRPKLNVKQVSVHLPVEICQRIDTLVGGYGRSAFIRQAIEKALDEAEKAVPPNEASAPS